MYLFSRLFQAARAWRNSGRPKTAKRSAVDVEQLDHRRLLSVNFSGNVATDFPATQSPGVVIFNSSNTPGIITPDTSFYGSLIPTSGYAISEIRVSYDSVDDTLSVGFGQPPADIPSDPTGQVIAGDADDNGNAGNVNPAVLALDPFFTEFPALEGQNIEMYSFLDLADTGTPDVVAGFSPNQPFNPPGFNTANMSGSPSPNPQAPKPYEVAQAVPTSMPNTGPGFGTLLPNNTGNVYLANQAAHPNLEFSITNFSQLYLQETGQALTPSSVIGIGAFAGNDSTAHIGDAFFPENTFTLSQATVPVPPVNPNPPPSPPILINPHEHRIIDTNHRDLIRVSVFGTSGLPVSEIVPSSVELNGVKSIAHINRKVQRDEFPFQTYVFVADQLKLPFGLTPATLTGTLTDGANFETQKDVLNLPHSALAFGKLKKFMGNATYYPRLAKIEAKDPSIVTSSTGATVSLASHNSKATGAAAVRVDYTPKVESARKEAKAEAVKVRPVVSIKKADGEAAKSPVSTRLRYSMDHFLSSAS
jgi:hypothetical protein